MDTVKNTPRYILMVVYLFQQTLFITTEQNSEKQISPPTQYNKQTNKKKQGHHPSLSPYFI